MKTLTLREENILVARVMLQNMKQDRCEPIMLNGPDFGGRQMYNLGIAEKSGN